MTYISHDADVPEKSVIIDAPKVGLAFLGCAVCVILAFFFFEPGKSLLWTIVFAILALIFLWRGIIIGKGYVINVPQNQFCFPGGGIEANSFTDYFNPVYLTQFFQRRSLPLGQIRSIQEFTDKTYYTDSQGRQRVRRRKMLEITGAFGAVTFEFTSKGKMDQLYSAIINLNKMGIPISAR